MSVCTIVTRRELARALVLAASLDRHMAGAELSVLLLDGDPASVEAIEGARMLGLEDVLGEASGLIAAANPPGALAIAALPRLLSMALEEGARSALYVGAGQRLLSPLSEFTDLLSDHQVVLVARRSATASRDDGSFLGDLGGCVYSSTLFGVRAGPASKALLDAWPVYFGECDGDDGSAAVCSWLNGIPAIVEDACVLRHPGYALDPWTLRERQLDWEGKTALVEERLARILDLGGLEPGDPASYFDGPERLRLSSSPALARLVAEHCSELLAAGYDEDAVYSFRFLELDDHARITPTMRKLIAQGVNDRTLVNSPFTAEGRAELYKVLNSPADRGAAVGLTRLHMAIWEARADLQASYPSIDGPDGAGFAGWLHLHGAEQEGLVAELLPPAPELAYRDADPHVHESEPRWGVNVVGFFRAELGVGEAARLLLLGLDAAEIPALPIQGRLAPPSRQGIEFEYARIDEAAYPVNILCINGDGIPVFAREAGRSFFEGRYTVALWWWEVGDPPSSWSASYEFVDEVWVGSRHIYDAIAPSSPVPVVQVTMPVLEPEVAPRTRAELGLPQDGFLFLFVHDYHSVAARKNPVGVIEAFRRAFTPGSGAKLVVKSINADTRPSEHERVMLAAAGHDDITLLDGYLSTKDKNAIIAACDCYVSLHRSEGFGLTVAEAMLLGKPVIVTRYGGTMDFTNDENSYLVRWRPVAVGEGSYPYAPADTWAEPDVDQAAALMREVLADPKGALARGELARHQMLEHHSPDAAGRSMRRRLALIHEELSEGGWRSLNLAHLPSLQDGDRVPAKIANPPSIDWGLGRLGRLKWRLQRPVAEWARAYIEHESAIDTETDRAIARIDARVREVAGALQEQQSAQHAETLAVLRRLESELASLRKRFPTEPAVAHPDGRQNLESPSSHEEPTESSSH